MDRLLKCDSDYHFLDKVDPLSVPMRKSHVHSGQQELEVDKSKDQMLVLDSSSQVSLTDGLHSKYKASHEALIEIQFNESQLESGLESSNRKLSKRFQT